MVAQEICFKGISLCAERRIQWVAIMSHSKSTSAIVVVGCCSASFKDFFASEQNNDSISSAEDIRAINKELEDFFGVQDVHDIQSTVSSAGLPRMAQRSALLPQEQTVPPAQDNEPRTQSSDNSSNLTHVDQTGRARMVDVGEKDQTIRKAIASASVNLGQNAFELVAANQVKKGDVLTVAQLAGVMAAKHTSLLIPLCHNIMLSQVGVHLQLDPSRHSINIQATAKTTGQTGVEMEALTAASVAALTVYDMCKAVSKDIVISDIRLEHKSGGKSGDYNRQP